MRIQRRTNHHLKKQPSTPTHAETDVHILPMTMSELCSADRWCVSLSCPLTSSNKSLSVSLLNEVDSNIPSLFHVRNWKVTDNCSPSETPAAGSDRKLLLELRKVAETCWGSEQVKVTFPWKEKLRLDGWLVQLRVCFTTHYFFLRKTKQGYTIKYHMILLDQLTDDL